MVLYCRSSIELDSSETSRYHYRRKNNFVCASFSEWYELYKRINGYRFPELMVVPAAGIELDSYTETSRYHRQNNLFWRFFLWNNELYNESNGNKIPELMVVLQIKY
jgi:hypothetical protein